MEKEKELEIDIVAILYAMRNKVVYIILSALIFATLAGCVTEFLMKPKYTTSCTMYVYSNTDRVSTDSNISGGELDASQRLVNTYIEVLKSNTVLEKVASELGIDAKPSQLKGLINCSQVEETEIFRVSVTTGDAQMSANIANAIAQVAPEEIVRVVKAGGVEVIDYAKVPDKPSSSSLQKNIVIGGGLGFILAFALFFVFAMFDTTITSEKDIERDFADIPILGTVPRLISGAKNPNAVTQSDFNAAMKGDK